MKKYALYSRVSTSDQNVSLQLREMEAYCVARGWAPIEIFTDEGVSGSKILRPQLNNMMTRVRAGKFTTVVVWRFDRFSRSTTHLLACLEEFRKLDVQFVSVSEQLDTSTPVGRVLFTIIGAFAEFERSVLIERVRSGMAAARAQGRPISRPRLISRLDLHRHRAAGMAPRKIARELGVHPASVRRILRKEVA